LCAGSDVKVPGDNGNLGTGDARSHTRRLPGDAAVVSTFAICRAAYGAPTNSGERLGVQRQRGRFIVGPGQRGHKRGKR